MPSQHREDFSKSMALLAVSLGFELDEPTIGVYWHSLRMIPAEIRREAFHLAIDRKWFKFPQPGELKALAAEVVSKKRQAAAALHLADCPHGAAHWLEDDHGNVIGRCPCWKAAQMAMDAVGQAIALPAVAGGYGDET